MSAADYKARYEGAIEDMTALLTLLHREAPDAEVYAEARGLCRHYNIALRHWPLEYDEELADIRADDARDRAKDMACEAEAGAPWFDVGGDAA